MQIEEYGVSRLIANTIATDDEKKGESAGTIGVVDVEEAEGARVFPSPRSEGRKEPLKMSPEQLVTWIEKEYRKLAEGTIRISKKTKQIQ